MARDHGLGIMLWAWLAPICAGQTTSLPALDFSVLSPPSVAGSYVYVKAQFGGDIPLNLTATVSAVSPSTGCSAMTEGSLTGKIALIKRGTCRFTVKAINAQNAGAAAVVIYNNELWSIVIMSGTDARVTIPVSGDRLRAPPV
jgi:hypothetical protein